jgi:nucleoid-associated protein YgaU
MAMLNGQQTEPVPPVGAAPPVKAPAVPVPQASSPPPPPGAGTAPVVRDFDTQTFRCTPTVNTFEAISQRKYFSPKYARALLLFNRKQMLDDSFRQDNPQLKVGQTVLIPPLALLESMYASEIHDTPAQAPAAVGPGPVSPPVARPQAGAPPAPAQSGTTPDADGMKVYVVQGNGEMMYEIAQKTLGDGRRWSEIYRLNPNVQPELLIAPGTRLRLPATARVGP